MSSETRAVALEEQLQYSCGMLVCTVRATSAILDDGDGDPTTTVKATGTNFPITGVILGGQKKLGFDFTPKDGEDQYFMYDNRISGVYLTDETSAPLKSLVSQTADGENVYFCLELRNDSGVIFAGAEGDIMPGSTFYLVGSMDMPPVESGFSSVFVRDHTSAVNCVVPSLAQALNSIPDLENPRLTLGVQANMNWVQSTPRIIPTAGPSGWTELCGTVGPLPARCLLRPVALQFATISVTVPPCSRLRLPLAQPHFTITGKL